MALPKRLKMGTSSPSPSPSEERERITVLRATIEHYLPEFAKSVAEAAKSGDGSEMLLHQDAFAAGYDDDEYTLLGMAIKYAGLQGVVVRIIGENHESF
jgi:hypothetical protein